MNFRRFKLVLLGLGALALFLWDSILHIAWCAEVEIALPEECAEGELVTAHIDSSQDTGSYYFSCMEYYSDAEINCSNETISFSCPQCEGAADSGTDTYSIYFQIVDQNDLSYWYFRDIVVNCAAVGETRSSCGCSHSSSDFSLILLVPMFSIALLLSFYRRSA